MRGFKTLICTTALLAPLALLPTANAQISISIGAPPVCSYGYYDYSPYGCAPVGYYGPGYFYNGIFLGMGPWAGWGYDHGWGSHRFSNSGGGSYTGGFHGYAAHGNGAGHATVVHTSSTTVHTGTPASRSHETAVHGSTSKSVSHTTAVHSNAPQGVSHTTAAHGSSSHGASHTEAAHSSASHSASHASTSHSSSAAHSGGGHS